MIIKSVIPEYTGGGVYCFIGELADGNYFLADCTCSGGLYSLRIVDDNPNDYSEEEIWHEEWQMKHFVKDVSRCKRFIKDMLKHIINEKPFGNYTVDDMKMILERL